MHEENGVKFYLQSGVKEIVGSSGKVVSVVLKSGETLEADVVLVGVGVVPDTEFMKNSGLTMTKRGELKVDKVKWSSGYKYYHYINISSHTIW